MRFSHFYTGVGTTLDMRGLKSFSTLTSTYFGDRRLSDKRQIFRLHPGQTSVGRDVIALIVHGCVSPRG